MLTVDPLLGVCVKGECPNNNDGCTSPCTSPPAHAHFYSGGLNGQPTSCLWICDSGYHYNQGMTGCDNCIQADPAEYCGGSSEGYIWTIVPPSECTPTLLPSLVCKQCQTLPFGTAIGWNSTSSTCMYRCQTGYYFISNMYVQSQTKTIHSMIISQNSKINSCVGNWANFSLLGRQEQW